MKIDRNAKWNLKVAPEQAFEHDDLRHLGFWVLLSPALKAQNNAQSSAVLCKCDSKMFRCGKIRKDAFFFSTPASRTASPSVFVLKAIPESSGAP